MKKSVEFASDLGLKPGDWPEHLVYKGISFERDMPLMAKHAFMEDLLEGYNYVPAAGPLEILVVLND